MTARTPLVYVNGQRQTLPAGDSLVGGGVAYLGAPLYKPVVIVNGQLESLQAGDTFSTGTGSGTVRRPLIMVDGSAEQIPYDGPNNWVCARSSDEWKAVGVATPPDHLYLCQEPSGDLADSIGATSLIATNAPTYSNAVTGWTRVGVGFTDGSTNQCFQTSSGVDLSANSFAWLMYVHPTTVVTLRSMAGAGGTETHGLSSSIVAAGNIQCFCNNVGINGVYADSIGNDRAILYIYNRTAATVQIYTDEEIIGGNFDAGITDGPRGIGNVFTGGHTPTFTCLYYCNWGGANAEMSLATVKNLFDALNIVRPWTVTFDGPSHWFVPTTAADFTFIGMTAPDSVWGFQEASGDILDTIGTGFTLTASVQAYRQAFGANWTRKCVTFTAGSSHNCMAAAGTGPNPATTSVMWGFYILPANTPSAQRHVMSAGGAAAASEASVLIDTTPHVQGKIVGSTTTSGNGDWNQDGLVRLMVLQYDRTNAKAVIYSDLEKLTLTYNAGVTDGKKGIGYPGYNPQNCQESCAWGFVYSGANAELSTTDVKNKIYGKLRISVPWS